MTSPCSHCAGMLEVAQSSFLTSSTLLSASLQFPHTYPSKRISFHVVFFFFLRSQPFSIFYKHSCISLLNHSHIHRHMFTETYISPLLLSLSSQDYVSQDLQLLLWLSFAFVRVCVCLCAETHSHVFEVTKY